jgi:uncharacterized membrane protein YkvA (DUF1232 family)
MSDKPAEPDELIDDGPIDDGYEDPYGSATDVPRYWDLEAPEGAARVAPDEELGEEPDEDDDDWEADEEHGWDEDDDELAATASAAIPAAVRRRDEFDDDLPSRGLLSFYDRLRERMLAAVERRGNRLGESAVHALLLVPDVFVLLVRLLLDGNVPGPARTLIGGALAYFVLPIDFLPEAIVGPVGYLDDLVLASAVLGQAFGGELEPYARRHWSGEDDVRTVLQDVTYSAQHLLGPRLFQKIDRYLERRGIRLPEEDERRR